MSRRYPGAWPYTALRSRKIHGRWVDEDPYGDDCGEHRVRADRHHAVLEGLRAARSDVHTLLAEIERLHSEYRRREMERAR